MNSMLRMETRHAADDRATNPFTNLNVVVDVKDVKDEAAGEAAAVAMAVDEDAVVEAVVKAMERKMMTCKPLLAFPTKSIKTCPMDSRNG